MVQYVFGAILDEGDTEREGEGEENDDDDDDAGDDDDDHIADSEGHPYHTMAMATNLQSKWQQRWTWQHIPQEDLKGCNGKNG